MLAAGHSRDEGGDKAELKEDHEASHQKGCSDAYPPVRPSWEVSFQVGQRLNVSVVEGKREQLLRIHEWEVARIVMCRQELLALHFMSAYVQMFLQAKYNPSKFKSN